MIQILFVCLGNICRSPLAHGVFQKKVRDLGWEEFVYVDSAGTSGWHQGEKPDRGSIHVARQHGLDITGQRSRPVSHHDNRQFQYFIAMDESNKQNLIHEFGVHENKVFKMRDFDALGKGLDVPDPYGHGSDSFQSVYEMILHSVDSFTEFLKERHPELP